jgi:glycosyltransferase involved in cell wall biosynthesis
MKNLVPSQQGMNARSCTPSRRPLRIGINTLAENPSAPTGATNYMVGFLAALRKVDPFSQYYLLVSPQNRGQFSCCEDAENFRFVNCYYSNENRYWRVLAEQLLIPYHSFRTHLDLVHSHSNVLPLLAPSRSVVNIKTTHHFHTPEAIPLARSLYRHTMHRMSAYKANRIIVSSSAAKEDVVKFYGVLPEKIDVVFEAAGENFTVCLDSAALESYLLQQYHIKGEYVLFVSTLWNYKNAEGTVRAFARVATAHPDLSLVIVGSDCEDAQSHLQKLATELGIGAGVRFLGHIPNHKLPALYQGALAFVYPSFYETFGLTIVEAFKCGCPVIASKRGSLPEVSGGAGILVEPSDIDAIANGIRALAENEALRDEYVQRGLKRGAEFSWTRTARETLSVFERVAPGPHGAEAA